MDPNAALALMREAQHDGRRDDADDHAEDIGAWLAAEGWAPDTLSPDERAYCLTMARARQMERLEMRLAQEAAR